MRLDENLKVAMEKLRQIDEVVRKLPGIDCGSCGCPNCLALAEDIVQGHAMENDCLYILKKKPHRNRGGDTLVGTKPPRRGVLNHDKKNRNLPARGSKDETERLS